MLIGIILFIIGVVTGYGGSLNIKCLQRNNKTLSFATDFFNQFLKTTVIVSIAVQYNSVINILCYHLGTATADILAIWTDEWMNKRKQQKLVECINAKHY